MASSSGDIVERFLVRFAANDWTRLKLVTHFWAFRLSE